jgi:hypothetical protein
MEFLPDDGALNGFRFSGTVRCCHARASGITASGITASGITANSITDLDLSI